MAKKSTKKTQNENIHTMKNPENESPFVVIEKPITKPITEIINGIKISLGCDEKEITSEIREKAAKFAKENHTYDECVWLFAEAELHFMNVYALYSDQKLGIITVVKPDQNQIRIRANIIAKQNQSLQALHWLYAERTILTEKMFKKII